jgi:threonine synthase
VDLVGELDARVAAVDGHGFRITPTTVVGDAAGGAVIVKDETGNVGGSHKGRHLFSTLLALETARRLGSDRRRPSDRPVLAIASCGNAALAAAILARAADHRLRVFVPVWADDALVRRLGHLGADVVRCPRLPGDTGDPSVLRFREAVAGGAVAFSCQGTDNALAADGGRTLGWELADQLGPAGAARVVVQAGGGVLAASVFRALGEAAARGRLPLPRLYAAQAAGAAPLARAWDRLTTSAEAAGWGRALAEAAADRGTVMWPWEGPASTATGILDDETYDWLEIVRAAATSDGGVVTVSEAALAGAVAESKAWGFDGIGPTGAAGLAGARTLGPTGARTPGPTGAARTPRPTPGSTVVLFTGRS